MLLTLLLRLSSAFCAKGNIHAAIQAVGECLIVTLQDSGGEAHIDTDMLAFAHAITQAHHGDLTWSSANGSDRFTLILPAATGTGVC